jgi:thiamine pyrophosphate-dependent acetolactate synthase large subunit-like protein
VDQNGNSLGIRVQSRQNPQAAKRFMRELMKQYGMPSVMIADKLAPMGAKGLTVYHPGDVRDALEEAHKMGGPVMIGVKVDPAASHHQVVDNDPL